MLGSISCSNCMHSQCLSALSTLCAAPGLLCFAPPVCTRTLHHQDLNLCHLTLVTCTQELAHRALCSQFKERSVGREYISITLGCPHKQSGRCVQGQHPQRAYALQPGHLMRSRELRTCHCCCVSYEVGLSVMPSAAQG